MLAFDQIFTQAARWEYMFGGNYPCTPCFKICIGRQWGNGPQHTGTYHSMFMQSLGMDIFIPSTPFEAYLHVKNILYQKRPSTILEHRWLYLNDQTFKPKNFEDNIFIIIWLLLENRIIKQTLSTGNNVIKDG